MEGKNDMQIVSKFGGSSLASASRFEKVKNIVFQNEARSVIVASAVGKQDESDEKVTDILISLCKNLREGKEYLGLLNGVCDRFLQIAKTLKLDEKIMKEIECFRERNLATFSDEYIISRGEYFTAKMLADFLGFEFVDAFDVLFFDEYGNFMQQKSREKLEKIICEKSKIVVPGFYGRKGENRVFLFSRGGSDVSGALLAKIINADLYENWTDVNGVFENDPKNDKNAHFLPFLTYNEMKNKCIHGAKVLHVDVLNVLAGTNIPIIIKNTNNPDFCGTKIFEK